MAAYTDRRRSTVSYSERYRGTEYETVLARAPREQQDMRGRTFVVMVGACAVGVAALVAAFG